MVAAGAVVCGVPAMTAVLIGVLMLGGVTRCPPVWSVPALLVAVLFPWAPLAFLPLLPVLFWSVPCPRGSVRGDDAWGGVVASAWIWHQGAADTGLGLVVAALMGLALVLSGVDALGRRPWRGAELCRFRPIVLLCVTLIAGQNGLQATAQAGAVAFFLDIAMQTVLPQFQRVASVMGFLRLPLPPLPGFVVLWLGIHAALGLASGVQGWSIAGIAIAMLLALFAFGDALGALRGGAGRRWPIGTTVLVCGAAVVLFPVSGMLFCAPAIHLLGGEWLWSVLVFSGGDGAHLRLVGLYVLIAGVWLVLVRPWTPQGVRALQAMARVPVSGGMRVLGQVVPPVPGLPWSARRVLVLGRRVWRQGRAIMLRGDVAQSARYQSAGHQSAGHQNTGWQGGAWQGGVWFWLVLLGLVLAVVGLAS